MGDGVSSRRSFIVTLIFIDDELDSVDKTLTHRMSKLSITSRIAFASSSGLLPLNPLSSTENVSASMGRTTSTPFPTLEWPPDELFELRLHEERYFSLRTNDCRR